MYIGRFAPSPTGPLHMGSLLAAVISYFEAKSHQGQWLVRIEDIDPPREQAGAADRILTTLEAHHLHWDGGILYQSNRHDAYEAAIEQLAQADAIYPCQCSRKQLNEYNQTHQTQAVHPKKCIASLDTTQPYALRAKPAHVKYHDLFQGEYTGEDGHFVVKRRDQLFAYQLAVVVDDIEQNISHVIRGHDLLDSTPKQLILYQALEQSPPQFGHFPVIVNQTGQKLSKQNHAPAINNDNALSNLHQIYHYLNIPLPDTNDITELLNFGCQQWNQKQFSALKQTSLTESPTSHT